MSGQETAAAVISVVALAASLLSAYFAIHGARMRRETAQLRAERLRIAAERNATRVEQWAVVQELLPFGYRIEKICDSQKQAEREASASQYLTAHPLAWVRSENERLSQPAEFTSELHDWARMNGSKG